MISVVVSTGSNEEHLKACLTSLKNQTIDQYEVIVVNYGGLKDYIEGLVKEFGFKYIYVDEKWAMIESRAKNFGIRAATGDIIVCLNDDVVLASNVLCGFLKYYESKNIYYVLSHRTEIAHIEEFLLALKNKKEERKHSKGLNDEARIDFIAGSKDMWNNLHGFDESFIWGGYERDTIQRARKKGYGVKELSPFKMKIYKLSNNDETERQNIEKIDSHIRWGRGDMDVTDVFWGVPKTKKDFQLLSAVLTVKNGSKSIEDCLNGLKNHKGESPISQLVVLFDKPEGKAETIISKFAESCGIMDMTMYKSKVQHNIAMSACKGDWILKVIDSDRFSPGLCEGLLYYMENPVVGGYQVRVGDKYEVRLVRRSNITGNQIAGLISVVHNNNSIMIG